MKTKKQSRSKSRSTSKNETQPGLRNGTWRSATMADGKPLATVPANMVPGTLRMFVGIDEILPDPRQPRTVFAEEKLKGLAESIKEHGVVQDLVVRRVKGRKWTAGAAPAHGGTGILTVTPDDDPLSKQDRLLIKGNAAAEAMCAALAKDHYELVDGERRWRAARLAELERVPVTVREVQAEKKLALQVVLNQQHENLSALEEAAAYQRAMEHGGQSAEDLAKSLGISRGTLFGRLALNRLSPAVREALVAGKISVSVATAITMVPGEKAQKELLEDIGPDPYTGEPMPFRDVQRLIEDSYCQPLRDAPFALDKVYEGEYKIGSADGKLSPVTLRSMGTCQACKWRSGNMEGIEAKNPNVCTQPRCYGAKAAVFAAEQIAAATAKGRKVLSKNESKGIFDRWSPTEPRGNYVDLGATCYEDKKRRSAREILGKDAPEPVMAFNGKGKLQTVWEAAAVRKALEGKGIKAAQQRELGGNSRWEAENRKRQELRTGREKLVPTLLAMLERYLKSVPALECWRFVLGWGDEKKWDRARARRGLKGTIDEATKGWTPEQLGGLAVEMKAAGYGGAVDWEGDWSECFQAACKLAGMDLKAEEKALTAKNAESTKAPAAKK